MADKTTHTENDTNFVLKVDGFGTSEFPDDGSFTSKSMTSYLRIGAVPVGAEPGDALIDYVQQAGPPGDPVRGDGAGEAYTTSRDSTAANAAGNRDVLFIDDVRQHDSVNPGHGASLEQRQDESAKLMTRGGWREHTDGNRIITTYGDSVEVVRGNYKMVVMGRQDDPGEAHGWDVGCAHIQDFAPGTMPGASVYQEMITDYNGNGAYGTGVYLLVNSTENVWEYARNAGNFREENWGDLHETYTGSENPKDISTCSTDGSEGHPQDDDTGDNDHKGARPPWANTDGSGMVRSNPHIIERTWASEIESQRGSATLPVPRIDEHVHADDLKQKQYLGDGSQDGFAYWSEVNVHGNELEMTNTIGIAKVELRHVIGLIVEETACVLYTQCKSALLHFDADIGFIVDGTLGASIEITPLNKDKVNMWDAKFEAVDARLDAIEQSVAVQRTQANAQLHEIYALKKKIHAQENHLNTVKSNLNAFTNLT